MLENRPGEAGGGGVGCRALISGRGALISTPQRPCQPWISSPAAVPALQRHITTHDAQLATLLSTVPVTRYYNRATPLPPPRT